MLESSESELPAPTYLISGGHGDRSSSVEVAAAATSDLDLGLDLGSLAWDLCDFIQTTSSLEDRFDNAASSLQANNDKSVLASLHEEEMRALENLDILDFEVSSDVWTTLNHMENSNGYFELLHLTSYRGKLFNDNN